MQYELKLGDCLVELKSLPDCSVDSIVTDPPAGIFFMGKDWDKDKGGRDAWISWMTEVAKECLRVLKPGGHALVWAIPRTSHWTGFAWEQAGWEPRDKVYHAFGTGFPKNHDVSKAIDKASGAEREQEWKIYSPKTMAGTIEPRPWLAEARKNGGRMIDTGTPATEAAKQWQGWGTALKPSIEEWWLFRKPLSEKTIAENVLKWGTGGLNIDGCRVGTDILGGGTMPDLRDVGTMSKEATGTAKLSFGQNPRPALRKEQPIYAGRWPAQLTHDGSDEVVGLFPVTGSVKGRVCRYSESDFAGDGGWGGNGEGQRTYDGSGSAARFFYCAKASKRDRDEGCEGLESRKSGMSNGAQINGEGYDKGQDIGLNRVISRRNHHPTVKATELMAYLCRLITPPSGVVLDPFAGSGSTGKAAIREGFRFIGIEQDPEYLEIAKCRIEYEFNKTQKGSNE